MTVLLLAAAAVAVANPSPIDYELKAVEYRRQIRSYHIDAVVQTDIAQRDANKGGWYAARVEGWHDGRQHRSDEWPIADWPARSTGVLRLIHCRGCLPDGKLFMWTPPLSASIDLPAISDAAYNRELQDLRRIGHTRYSFFGDTSLAGELASPEVNYLSAERLTYKGEEAVLVRSKYVKHDLHRRTWLAPDKGNSLLRLEVSQGADVTPAQPVLGLLDIELAQDMPSGVWFPKRARAEAFVQGELSSWRTIEMKAAEFNRPLDPAAFTLKNMNITPGTPVMNTETAQVLVWDGQAIAKHYRGPPPPEMMSQAIRLPTPAASGPSADPLPPDPTRTPAWVYAVAAGLAVVGCGLLILALQFRR